MKAVERFKKFGWDDKTAIAGAIYELFQGQPLGALRALVCAARLSPFFAEAHHALGVVLNALGAPEQALVHYDLAARFRPKWLDALDKAATVATALVLAHALGVPVATIFPRGTASV